MTIIDKVKGMAQRRAPKKLTVKAAKNITPNMRRVTLQGSDLANLPKQSEGAYIKLMFEQADQSKPIMRTYTVSEQRSAANEIDVDFMLHSSDDGEVAGVAAPWSMHTQSGDHISLMGPGPAKFINTDAECFLLAADMTALPALTANLKLLPETAQGQAFIEILSEEDKQTLKKPDNVEIIWVVNPNAGSDESPLFHAIEQGAWKEGQRYATWVACEFKTMKKIRQYLKEVRAVEKSHLYVSSYWKKGASEDVHKLDKQEDAKQAG